MSKDTIYNVDIEFHLVIGNLFDDTKKEITVLSQWIELTDHLE